MQYPHSIMDRWPLGPGILLIFGHSQRDFKESKLLEFFWDKVDIVGMVEVDGEDIVISFGGAWLESSTVEFDELFFLNYCQCCWLINWCGAWSRTRFFIHSPPPPPGGSFLCCSWQCSEFCSDECVMKQTLSAIF